MSKYTEKFLTGRTFLKSDATGLDYDKIVPEFYQKNRFDDLVRICQEGVDDDTILAATLIHFVMYVRQEYNVNDYTELYNLPKVLEQEEIEGAIDYVVDILGEENRSDIEITIYNIEAADKSDLTFLREFVWPIMFYEEFDTSESEYWRLFQVYGFPENM